MADRRIDAEQKPEPGHARPVGTPAPTPDHTPPADAGKTSGGGSLGHDQPEDVSRASKVRNDPGNSGKTGGQRDTP